MWGRLVREGKSGLGQVLPLTLGSDISGTVAAVGVGVDGLALGEAVYGATNDRFVGGYAEYALVEAGKVAPDEAYVRSKGVRAAYFIVDVTRDRLERIRAMVERGTLDLPIGEVLDLADASTAHGMLDGAPHKAGKIVLKVAD